VRYDNCTFVIRLLNDHRVIYAAGSSLHIDRGHLTATDASGTQRHFETREWLDVIIDAAAVRTNRWRAGKRH
jgi:hypothetical protein